MSYLPLLNQLGAVVACIIRGRLHGYKLGLKVIEMDELIKLYNRIDGLTDKSVTDNLKSIRAKHDEWLSELDDKTS